MESYIKFFGVVLLLSAVSGFNHHFETFDCYDLEAVVCKEEFQRQLIKKLSASSSDASKDIIDKLINYLKAEISENANAESTTDLKACLSQLEAEKSYLAKLFDDGDLFDLWSYRVPAPPSTISNVHKTEMGKIVSNYYTNAMQSTLDIYVGLYARLYESNPKVLDIYPEFKTFYDDFNELKTVTNELEKFEKILNVLEKIRKFYEKGGDKYDFNFETFDCRNLEPADCLTEFGVQFDEKMLRKSNLYLKDTIQELINFVKVAIHKNANAKLTTDLKAYLAKLETIYAKIAESTDDTQHRIMKSEVFDFPSSIKDAYKQDLQFIHKSYENDVIQNYSGVYYGLSSQVNINVGEAYPEFDNFRVEFNKLKTETFHDEAERTLEIVKNLKEYIAKA